MNYRIVRPDGQIRWIHVKAKAVRNDNGEIIGHAGSARDISDLKNNEEDLKKLVFDLHQKDQYMASIMETQNEMICRFLPDTTLTFANKAYCRQFGIDEKDLIGKKFLELTPSSDVDDIMGYLDKLSIDNPYDTYVQKLIGPDSSEVWQEWTDYAIFNLDNQIVEFQSVGRDITIQKQSEEAIANYAKTLEETQRIAKIGSYVVDIIGHTCQNSSLLNEILGLEANETQPLEVWSNLIHPDDLEAVLSAHNTSIEELVNYNQEYRLIRPNDGAERWISDVGEIETDDQGRAVKIIGTMMDITDRKKKEGAEKANAAKSEFLSTMSHEIRTPLNAIIGFTDLTLQTILSPQQDNYLRKIKSSCDILLNLIGDILDVSKLEDNAIKLESIPFNFEDMILEAISQKAVSAKNKDLDIIIDVDNDVPIIS